MSGERKIENLPDLSLPEQISNSHGNLWAFWEKLVNSCSSFRTEIWDLLLYQSPDDKLRSIIDLMRILVILEDRVKAARPKHLFNFVQEKLDLNKLEVELTNYHIYLHDNFFIDNFGNCRHTTMFCPIRKTNQVLPNL